MKSRFIKICCMLVTMAFLFHMLPVQALSANLNLSAQMDTNSKEAIPHDSYQEESTGEATVLEEILDRRTQFSKEFLMSNGLSLAVVYPEAVHYENNGNWEEINNTLKISGNGANAMLTNTAGAWDVTFPQLLTGSNMISVSKAGYTVSFGMAGEVRITDITDVTFTSLVDSITHKAAGNSIIDIVDANVSAAVVQQPDLTNMRESMEYPETFIDTLFSKLRYENVYENTDVEYDLSSGQLKESIIMESYDSTLQGYRYTLNTGTMIPVLEDDGSIILYTPDGETVVMTMPAPFLLDNNGERNDDVEVVLMENGTSYLMTYYLPKEWLVSGDRAWPVVLDPIISADGYCKNVEDQTVMQYNNPSYTEGIVQCGYNEDYGIMRFLIKYTDLPDLTSADVIVHAQMKLVKPYDSGTTASVEVHKVQNSWSSSSVTWSNKPSYNAIIEDYAISKNAGDYYWDVTSIVQDWYATGVNNGMMFKASDEVEAAQTANWKQFYSSDYSTESPTLWPTLTIIYRNVSGIENYWDYTANGAGRTGMGYVNDYSGNLVWVRNDIGFDGNRMPVSISHIYNSNDSQNNEFGLGNGWRTNYNQKAYKPEGCSYYVWEDGDGTKHYFNYNDEKCTYVDEDGLELTLTVLTDGVKITDKYDNASYFDNNARLIKIENNQKNASYIEIIYTEGTVSKIATIKDGVGRSYNFTYDSGGLLNKITYVGKGAEEISSVSYLYTGTLLTQITDKDGKYSEFAYTSENLLSNITDVDGYRLAYTYTTTTPRRVSSVSEYQIQADGTLISGGSLSISYSHNQTKFTDHNGNVQIMQFNDFGNTISVQDGEGRAQYAQYALNRHWNSAVDGSDGTIKANQLRLSSKMQNTVTNIEQGSNFESSYTWSRLDNNVSVSSSTETAYLGNKSMKIVRSADGVASGVSGTQIIVESHGWGILTFSAYVKTGEGASAFLAFGTADGTILAESEVLESNQDWTRLEVSYTPVGTEEETYITPQVLTTTAGTIYVDCVQVETMPTASRYNMLDNGDWWGDETWLASKWTKSSEMTENDGVVETYNLAMPRMEVTVLSITGDPQTEKYVSQTISQSGSAGDCYVLAGWAYGDSAPLDRYENDTRAFGMKLIFNNTDGTKTDSYVSFNPDIPSDGGWQYAAVAGVADKDYESVTVQLLYNNNVNTVYFDGIQLFKESFGSSYAYDADGNVTTVIDLQRQQTTYEYNDSGDLTKILQGNKAKMTYTYDDWHNVKTATTEEGVVYEFAYDDWGNNTSVSITSGGATITSTATYSTDGNILVSTKNALDKTTQYGYNINTNVLEWVQYPEDDENTRTEYSYDSMYRLATATADVDSGYSLDAAYTYTDDLLTQIGTNSTIYSFTYGDFAQRSTIEMGEWSLASYDYTDDQNRYLDKLTYGNGDFVNYTYDAYGRVTAETFEDGDTVTYEYDNTGALATVTDSATGIKTSYYYDLTDRLMKYVESDGTNTHSVGYEYDTLNNLTLLVETINGVPHTTSYAYDDDNRVTSVTASLGGGSTKKEYTYDNSGRVGNRVTSHNGANILTESFNFRSLNETSTTGQIASVAYTFGGSNVTYSYTYDGNGNITSVSDGTYVTTYVYDSANQLTRENNQAAGKTWIWTYDDAGNILTKQEYAYTTGTLGTVVDTITYTYSDSDWGDLLTGYGDETIRYDNIGNPILDGTWTYTWGHGRELESMFRVLTGGANNAGLQVETDSTGVKNGLFLDSDGEIRYYEDGSITRSGLIYVNGYYYYIRSSGVAARNTSYWVTNNNGLMESTTYHFDAYGRMIDPPDGSYIADVGGTGMRVDYTYDADGLRKTKTVTTGELFSIPRNGLHWDEDGELRYYRNGYLTRVGLIYVDGHYYYIKSDGTAVRNQEYWISHNNGLLPNQDYIFNEYGWLTNPESDKEIEVKMSTNNAVSADMYFDWTLNPGTATSVTYTYTYNGGTLAQMTGGGDTLSFSYDASGKPMAVTWGTTTYLYLTNLQGDVIAILDTAGNQVVQYTYDAWGKILTTTGTLANTLGTLNPITYRGYAYDTETELYYLQSRYYNPTIGKFLNADALVSTGQGLLGNNMFAYCRNNPVTRKDACGTEDISVTQDDDGNPLNDMGTTYGGGSSGGYRYGVDFSQAAKSSLVSGGLYNTGYTTYSYYTSGDTTTGKSSVAAKKNTIPQEAKDTLEYVEKNGYAPQSYKGGAKFKNDGRNGGQILPSSGAPYHEYDIYPHIKGVPRGSERIVIGADGSAWYTADHYISFVSMR